MPEKLSALTLCLLFLLLDKLLHLFLTLSLAVLFEPLELLTNEVLAALKVIGLRGWGNVEGPKLLNGDNVQLEKLCLPLLGIVLFLLLTFLLLAAADLHGRRLLTLLLGLAHLDLAVVQLRVELLLVLLLKHLLVKFTGCKLRVLLQTSLDFELGQLVYQLLAILDFFGEGVRQVLNLLLAEMLFLLENFFALDEPILLRVQAIYVVNVVALHLKVPFGVPEVVSQFVLRSKSLVDFFDDCIDIAGRSIGFHFGVSLALLCLLHLFTESLDRGVTAGDRLLDLLQLGVNLVALFLELCDSGFDRGQLLCKRQRVLQGLDLLDDLSLLS